MKKLFCVKDSSGKVVKQRYFESKIAAKVLRKDSNGVDEEGQEAFGNGHTVAIGPEHWRA